MKKAVLEVYAMAVCFFAITVITISLSMTLFETMGSINPGFTLRSYTHEKYVNNEKFIAKKGVSKDEAASLSEEEITAKREAAYEEELRGEKRKNTQSALRSASYAFVALIVFLIHLSVARNARKIEA